MRDLWFQNTKIVNMLPITIMIASSAKMITKKMDVDEGMSFFVLLSRKGRSTLYFSISRKYRFYIISQY